MHRNDQDQLEGIGILVGLPGQLRDRFVSALTSMCLRVPACSDTAWLPDVSQAASLRLIILGDSPGRAEEQCRAVRLQRIRAPIIVLQPARSIERKNCLLAAGADRVLTTEPHGRVVVHARRLLDESLRVFTEPIRHGPFMCDVRRNLATAMGERLELFPTERLLLASLIREPGIIVPWRDLTFDVLRRPPDEATQKALYHCFWRTKQKLGRLGKWLRAHRGIGY